MNTLIKAQEQLIEKGTELNLNAHNNLIELTENIDTKYQACKF